jgi:colanic acid biosynthesis glycosyl transferase WcaI
MAMREQAGRASEPPNRFFLLENWVDCGAIYPLNRPSAFRQELALPDTAFVALYSGNMGEKQGLEIIVEAARALAGMTDIHFVMCGDGAARGRMASLAAGLQNMRWLPLQPLDRLNELLNLPDVHLLPQRACASNLVMPSKLTGMLASGKPVLATAIADTELARVANLAGVVVPPEDVQAFTTALLQLKSDAALCVAKGIQARRYAEEHYAVDAVLGRFEVTMQQCVDAGKRG